jgi:hypothetical protein
MRTLPRDPKNYLRLQKLPADEAIRCYIEGEFTIGEEVAICDAVHKGMRLNIDKNIVKNILAECMLDQASVEECKHRLISGTIKYDQPSDHS